MHRKRETKGSGLREPLSWVEKISSPVEKAVNFRE